MKRINRREFLGDSMMAAAAIPGFQIVAPHVVGLGAGPSPNEKVAIGGIGIGGVGLHNLQNLRDEAIVALCDLDHTYAAKAFEAFPEAHRYKDYKEMLANEDLDAVLIATPDHTHAVITLAALKAGKHIYCQKPLTHTVEESRVVVDAAKKAGVITQMGIQGHSMEGARQLREWMAAGVIGPVRHVISWCTLCYYPWGHAYWSPPLGTRPVETPPVPEGMDWDAWIGPAPMRPYHPTYHPMVWRGWWDFGSSMMADRGVHTLDPVFWALDLGAPEMVSASVSDLNEETYPAATVVRFRFGARGDMPPVTLDWYDGMQPPGTPDVESFTELGEDEGGILLVGDDGMITAGIYGNSPRLVPEAKHKAFTPPPETIPRVKTSHEMDWTNAIREGRQPGATFDYSGPLSELVLLGNIAKRYPRTNLKWDTASMSFPDHAEATAHVRKTYREGWELG
jgi:predicted dehydrogenase